MSVKITTTLLVVLTLAGVGCGTSNSNNTQALWTQAQQKAHEIVESMPHTLSPEQIKMAEEKLAQRDYQVLLAEHGETEK
jgi:Tfp pilus assembly protein PilP